MPRSRQFQCQHFLLIVIAGPGLLRARRRFAAAQRKVPAIHVGVQITGVLAHVTVDARNKSTAVRFRICRSGNESSALRQQATVVMRGLVPRIHVAQHACCSLSPDLIRGWMVVTSTAMTSLSTEPVQPKLANRTVMEQVRA